MSATETKPLLTIRGVKTYYGNIIALDAHGAVLHYMHFDRNPPAHAWQMRGRVRVWAVRALVSPARRSDRPWAACS